MEKRRKKSHTIKETQGGIEKKIQCKSKHYFGVVKTLCEFSGQVDLRRYSATVQILYAIPSACSLTF